MTKITPSRREFLASGGSAFGATWLAMSLPALLASCEQTWDQADGAGGFEVLTLEEATELGAIVAQIIPTTDTPGAREAGVIHFLDAAFGTFFARMLDPIRGGLDAVQAKVAESHESSPMFSSLSDDEQIAVMKGVESESYFGLMRFVTVVGMFSHPKYGGNKGKVGWDMIGFDDRHVWHPPFGHYDEEYRNAGE